MAPDLQSLTSRMEQGPRGPLVLLFYDGFERQAREPLLARAKAGLRARARAIYRGARGKQVFTGFYVAFLALHDALKAVGCDVRVNDFAAARSRPDYPIGIGGYPSVLDHVKLPNPTIFGPGDPGYPDAARAVAASAAIRLIIQPSDWFVDYYRPYCGDKMIRWPAGIDTKHIEDQSAHPKSLDVVVYDKIRWHYDRVRPAVLDPLLRHLEARNLSYKVLRYGSHRQQDFFDTLKSARSMAFICEHETQGLACEEAMAMNLPIFAWDEGELVDPKQKQFAAADLRVSSVPYFSPECGVTFKANEVEPAFDRFWSQLDNFHPRDYIIRELGLEKTAREYLRFYNDLAPSAR